MKKTMKKVVKVKRSVDDLAGACSCCGAKTRLVLPVAFPRECFEVREDVKVCFDCWEAGMIGHMMKASDRVKASILTRLNWLGAETK